MSLMVKGSICLKGFQSFKEFQEHTLTGGKFVVELYHVIPAGIDASAAVVIEKAK